MAKNYYQERIAAGLCGKCGGEKDTDGALCQGCREQAAERAAKRRATNKAEGKCPSCGKRKVAKGKSKCRKCLDYQAEKQKDRASEWKQQGLCQSCGATPKEGRTLCQSCIDERSQTSSRHYRERKAAGTCCFCHRKPVEGQVVCAYHLQQKADYRSQIKLAAFDAYGGPVCSECGEDDVSILEIDHINGGGTRHRKELGMTGGYQFYLWLRNENYPDGYRVLCPTCNKRAHVGSTA